MRKNTKKIVTTLLASACIFGVSASAVMADSLKYTKIEVPNKIEYKYEEKYLSFEDFMKHDIKKKDVSEEDLVKLEKLYKEYISYLKEGKYDSAKEAMSEFKIIIKDYEDLYKSNYVAPVKGEKPFKLPSFTVPTFDDFVKNDLKKVLNSDTYSKMKKLYEDAEAAAKSGDGKTHSDIITKIFESCKDLVDTIPYNNEVIMFTNN